MERKILFGLLFLLAASLPASAQTVDEVINKYVEANGGMEKINQLHTVIQTGTLEREGMETTIKYYIKNNVGYKMEIEHEGVINYELANLDGGFDYFPSFGREEVSTMPEEIYTQKLFNIYLLPAFINYAEHNNTVEFKGIMETDEAVAYKLEVATEAGQRIDYFIDKKTGNLIKTIYRASQKEEANPIREIKYSDFRVVGDKYIFPFNVADDQIGTFQFTTIEVNVPIKESQFKP